MDLDFRPKAKNRPALVDARVPQLWKFGVDLRVVSRSVAARLDASRFGASTGLGIKRARCCSPTTEYPAASFSCDGLLRGGRKTLIGCNSTQQAVAVGLHARSHGWPCSVCLGAANDCARSDATLCQK
jgi:hypothetical protein